MVKGLEHILVILAQFGFDVEYTWYEDPHAYTRLFLLLVNTLIKGVFV